MPLPPDEAATRIQCFVRCFLARNAIAKKQEEMKKTLRRVVGTEMDEAALCIECAWRTYQSRRLVSTLLKERGALNAAVYFDNAATSIQALWRGHRVRKLSSQPPPSSQPPLSQPLSNESGLTGSSWASYPPSFENSRESSCAETPQTVPSTRLKSEEGVRGGKEMLPLSGSMWWVPGSAGERQRETFQQARIQELLQHQYAQMEKEDQAGLFHFAALLIQCCWRVHRARRHVTERRRSLAYQEARQELALLEGLDRQAVLRQMQYGVSEMVMSLKESMGRSQGAPRFPPPPPTPKPAEPVSPSVAPASLVFAQPTARMGRAAAAVQRAWQQHTARRAAAALAAGRAGHFARTLRLERTIAARRIQRLWRQCRPHHAARHIALWWRSCRAQRQLQALQRTRDASAQAELAAVQVGAAVAIQRAVRRHQRHALQLRAAAQRQATAATRIQALVRGRRDRLHTAALRATAAAQLAAQRRADAAARVQSVWRGALVRRAMAQRTAALRGVLTAQAVRLQRGVRGWLVRKAMDLHRAAHAARVAARAARRLQRLWRVLRLKWQRQAAWAAIRASHVARAAEDLQTDAATVIQAGVRRWLVCVACRRLAAALQVQQWYRKWHALLLARRLRKRLHTAALQRAVLQMQNEVACIIQSRWRVFAAQNALLARRAAREAAQNEQDALQVRNAAATTIQCLVRVRQANARVAYERLCRRACVRLQAFWRVQRAAQRLLKLRLQRQLWVVQERRRAGATTLQRVARGWLARRQAAAMRRWEDERVRRAVVLQCAWRSAGARHRVTTLLLRQALLRQTADRHFAAATIQRVVRGRQVRSAVRPLLLRALAAQVAIACAWRSAVARATTASLRAQHAERTAALRQGRAATKIQALWRGVTDRRVVRERRVQRSLARTHQRWLLAHVVNLQRVGRAYAVRAALRPEHRRQVAAAVAIQRVARGWAGRAVARRRRREAADRAALERTRPLVERFLADREHNRAISEEKQKLRLVARQAIQRKEAQARIELKQTEADAWGAVKAAVSAAAPPPRAPAAEVPFVRPHRLVVDSSSEGLFLKGWLEWMEQMGLGENRAVEALLMREAAQRRKTCAAERKAWEAAGTTEVKDRQLVASRQWRLPEGWDREDVQRAQQFVARTNRLKKDVAQAYDPQWLRRCLEADAAAQDEAVLAGRDADALASTLWQPREPPALVSAASPRGWEAMAMTMPVRRGAASKLPALSASMMAEPTALAESPAVRLAELEQALAQHSAALDAVDLRGRGLTDSAVLPLLAALKRNPAVHTLLLDDNRLSDASGIELAKCLQVNPALRLVSVSGNADITDLSAKHWLNALKTNTTLQTLLCERTQVTEVYSSQVIYLLTFSAPQTQLLSKRAKATLPPAAPKPGSPLRASLPMGVPSGLF